jgi:hypothetical protein
MGRCTLSVSSHFYELMNYQFFAIRAFLIHFKKSVSDTFKIMISGSLFSPRITWILREISTNIQVDLCLRNRP